MKFNEWLSKKHPVILFVCTGNTCRSPMAEQIAKRLIPDATILSAGVSASGESASDGAKNTMKKIGLDLSNHISRKLTPEMLKNVDVVVTMGEHHKKVVEEMTDRKIKIINLNVSDPYGGDDDLYESTAQEIEKKIKELVVPELI